jgi:hypothetical protein
MAIIAILVAMFQGSLLVKYFTKFTKDIFAALVSIIYIFEPFRKLSLVFMAHPLTTLNGYCGQQQDVFMGSSSSSMNQTLTMLEEDAQIVSEPVCRLK